MDEWTPKTELGRKVKSGEISDLRQILDKGVRILDEKVVDALVPDLEDDLLLIGQAKGKFGGGQRRIFKQTQKKTKEGNVPSFTSMAAVGNKNGFVGLGLGKSKETVPAREKAIRQAKLNMIYVPRGSGSWQSTVPDQNSIPFKVSGKCGSCEITLFPAPVGTGLIVEKECAKLLRLAGIKDVRSVTRGQTKVKTNLLKACFEALRSISDMKVSPAQKMSLGMTKQQIQTVEEIANE